MAKVVGVGGVFFKASDSQALSAWYRDVLGIAIGEYWAVFKADAIPAKGYTAFSVFKDESTYFDVPDKIQQQRFMINFMVDDLDAMLAQVKQHGGQLVGEPEAYDYGKFGWVVDPEGNKIELWQPT